MNRHAVLTLIAISASFLAAGCGSSVLDTAKGESRIQALVLEYTGQAARASCPRNVPLHQGLVTICRVTAADGSSARVRLKQTDGRGDVALSSELLHTAMVERRIAADATAKLGFKVTITCPQLIEVAMGSQFDCGATDPHSTQAPVHVKITDNNGSFTYSIPPAGR